MSLADLKAKIIDDAKADAAKIAEQAAEEVRGIIAAAEKELETLKNKVDRDALRLADERYQNIVTLARVESKNQVLSVKQKMLGEVFIEALRQLQELPKDRFLQFAESLLLSNPPEGETRLMVGLKNRPHIDDAFVKKLNEKLGAKGRFVVVENDRGFEYGFYLITDRVEIDLTYPSILRAVREDAEMEIIGILFGKG